MSASVTPVGSRRAGLASQRKIRAASRSASSVSNSSNAAIGDRAERGGTHPLQVIDEHDHGPFRRRDGSQHFDTRPSHPRLPCQRSPGSGGTVSSAANSGDVGRCRGQQTRVGTDRRQDSASNPGQLVLRLGQEQPAQRAKGLMDRVVL
jgi:hypothetical protein